MNDENVIDLTKASISELIYDYGMSVKDIYEKTDYQLDEMYPEVIAEFIMLNSRLQIAFRFSNLEDIKLYSDVIVNLVSDWNSISNGEYPILTAEQENPEFFELALDIIEKD